MWAISLREFAGRAEGEPRNGGGRGAWALNGTARVLSRPRGERCP